MTQNSSHVIKLRSFGNVLVSRPAGLEAFSAIRPTLDPRSIIQIDFEGILTVTPSWFDEFITHLAEYQKGKVELLPTENASVLAILPVLAYARNDVVASIVKKAIHQFPSPKR